jgi:hypothetical protein
MTQMPPPYPPGNYPPGSYPPGYYPPPGPGFLKPHRGTVILVLGILGLMVCAICGIVAWVWANADLREMDAGVMDRSGRDMTNAGRILGIVSAILACIGVCFGLLWLVVALVIA